MKFEFEICRKVGELFNSDNFIFGSLCLGWNARVEQRFDERKA